MRVNAALMQAVICDTVVVHDYYVHQLTNIARKHLSTTLLMGLAACNFLRKLYIRLYSLKYCRKAIMHLLNV